MIFDEPTFLRLLAFERKRCQRAGTSFALALLHGTGLDGAGARLRSALRDTDLVGWYRRPSTLGVIFTTFGQADCATVRSRLEGKLRAAIGAQHERLRITLHFFPDDSESDEILYPDVKAKDSVKRAVDVTGSLCAILLLAPAWIVIPLLIRLDSGAPVFFRQKRLGQFGRGFELMKFRTMRAGSDDIHRHYVADLIQRPDAPRSVYKIVADPRVTRVGRILRRSSLDELPQLFNVLKGDMSLVGPRPPIPYEVEVYRAWHRRRVIESKPGITGLWQVSGRSRTNFDEMVRLDLRYIRTRSLWLDLKILLKTPRAVLAGTGAY